MPESITNRQDLADAIDDRIHFWAKLAQYDDLTPITERLGLRDGRLARIVISDCESKEVDIQRVAAHRRFNHKETDKKVNNFLDYLRSRQLVAQAANRQSVDPIPVEHPVYRQWFYHARAIDQNNPVHDTYGYALERLERLFKTREHLPVEVGDDILPVAGEEYEAILRRLIEESAKFETS